MQTASPAIPIVKAEGVYLYSEDGKRYLDGISSWWVNLHGHTHPYIIDKITAQLNRLEHVLFAGFTHAPAVELAVRLLEIIPGGMSKIFYSDNGSTAVEAALKIALQYWYNQNPKTVKTKVICLKNSYHGDTFGAMSAAGKNAFNVPFWKHLFEIESIDPPLKGAEERSLAQLKAIIKEGTAACLIFEPLILGVGGMIIYPAAGLNTLIECCKEHEVLTIADEVMTGFGRTGSNFACDQLIRKPDLICLSKGLTGGFLPLGATACREEIYGAFMGDRLEQAFLHGHSYTGNPLACASALASLDLLLQAECVKQRGMIASLHMEFCQQWRMHPKLARCESLGTILVVEYRVESGSSYFQPIREWLYGFFMSKGILIRPFGNVIHFMPPYCITEHELRYVYEQIILSLETI